MIFITGKTHLMAGVTTALLLGTNTPEAILIGFGSLLPDIDHSGSKLGHLAKPISVILKHRGFTHSLLFCLICSIINPFIGIGVLTHLILDFLTPKGEQLLWPINKNIKLPFFSRFIKTGNIIEYIFLAIMTIACIILVVLTFLPENNQSFWDVWVNNFTQIKNYIFSLFKLAT